IEKADGALKHKLGRLAYVWTGARATTESARPVTIKVDGGTWFDDKASCVLIGNMGTLVGGMDAFPDADPADGLLELGVVTAEGAVEWARVLTRLAVGSAEKSPLTRMTRARDVDIRFDEPVRYELDGGDQIGRA